MRRGCGQARGLFSRHNSFGSAGDNCIFGAHAQRRCLATIRPPDGRLPRSSQGGYGGLISGCLGAADRMGVMRRFFPVALKSQVIRQALAWQRLAACIATPVLGRPIQSAPVGRSSEDESAMSPSASCPVASPDRMSRKSLERWCRHTESNCGPTDYESVALPLSYAGAERAV